MRARILTESEKAARRHMLQTLLRLRRVRAAIRQDDRERAARAQDQGQQ